MEKHVKGIKSILVILFFSTFLFGLNQAVNPPTSSIDATQNAQIRSLDARILVNAASIIKIIDAQNEMKISFEQFSGRVIGIGIILSLFTGTQLVTSILGKRK